MTDLQDDLRLVAEWYGWELDADWRIKRYSGTTPILSENIDWFLTPDGMVELMDHAKKELGIGHIGFWDASDGVGAVLSSDGMVVADSYTGDLTRTRQEALVRAIAKMLRAEK